MPLSGSFLLTPLWHHPSAPLGRRGPGEWPGSAGTFVTTSGRDELLALIELGAARGESHRGHGFVWAAMADPEGKEFCIGHPES